jgi:exodeoxyribonuclease VII large subunit
MQLAIRRSADRLGAIAARLESLSPLAVLGRGYSVTLRTATDQPVVDAASLSRDEQITSRLARGEVISRVEQILPGGE